MSQSAEKNKRKAWKKDMRKLADVDFENMVDDLRIQKKIIKRQKITIICLCILLIFFISGSIIYWKVWRSNHIIGTKNIDTYYWDLNSNEIIRIK